MGVCEEPCQPDCLDKECGDDGCGGACGICGGGQSCQSGICISCAPDCLEKDCGPDGCGGTCGECPEDAWCSEEDGWCILDGQDVRGEDDVQEGAIIPRDEEDLCGEDELLLYGKCVPSAPPPDDADGEHTSGCAAAPAGRTPWLLILAVTGLAVLRRGRERGPAHRHPTSPYEP